MKNKNNSFRLLFILIIAFSLFNTSCGHDPIFNIINSEVKPEKNGICGHINSFVTFNGNLYLATNFLYEKPLNTYSANKTLNGGWTRITDSSTEPFNGRQIIFIVADCNYLYAYTITYGLDEQHTNVPDSVIIYYSSDARTWNPIDNNHFYSLISDALKETILTPSEKEGVAVLKALNNPFRYIHMIFDNNAYDSADKRVYAVIVYNINADGDMETRLYALDGNNAPVEIPAGTNNSINMNTLVSKENASYSPRYSLTAVNFNGADYFFEYKGAIADKNYIYLSPESNKVYIANGWEASRRKTKVSDILKSYTIEDYGFTLTKDGITESAKTVSINSGSIISFGITKDKLILGTTSGIAHVNFDSDRIPGTELQSFSTNAASVLHSPYNVLALFVVDSFVDPLNLKDEINCEIYASNEYKGYYSTSTTALFEDIGLWAYYPERGNWNKDGTSAGKNKKTHLPAGN